MPTHEPLDTSSISLLNPNALQHFLSTLPTDAYRAVEGIMAWLDACSKADLDGITRFGIVRALDEAAQTRVKALALEYLYTPRLVKIEEARLWDIIHGFWYRIAEQYHLCLDSAGRKDNSSEQLKPDLPLVATRAIAALGEVIKWESFNYGAIPNDYWARLGKSYLLMEQDGNVKKSLPIYPDHGGVTSPLTEYLCVLFFQSSSLNNLQPLEIELADRLIAHLQPDFVFSAESSPQSVWWADADKAIPPLRLAQQPREMTPTLRFFHPGEAQIRLRVLEQEINRGGSVPAWVSQGEAVSASMLLSVIEHLIAYWAPTPPQRQHERHQVKHKMVVLPGLVNAIVMVSPEFGGKPSGLPLESWIVENVSQGGFGALVKDLQSDWVRVGALLVLQPGGAGNWLVGVVRRYQRISDNEAQVGIETLSRRIASVDVRPRADTPDAPATPGSPALWLQDDDPKGDIRFILPCGTFNARENLEFDYNSRRIFLTPLKLLERGSDYEVATFHATVAGQKKG
ncbi:hypothetical protein AGMMS49545_18590 [Betaproteobacteria bacterium]|nr:hypothetical protein AGMMS49545_18590 [Betaproteobacteria bacterium]GHU41913.1 hypothetical protein AGMMS50289_05820 [Betaproteobacteria bacterium]